MPVSSAYFAFQELPSACDALVRCQPFLRLHGCKGIACIQMADHWQVVPYVIQSAWFLSDGPARTCITRIYARRCASLAAQNRSGILRFPDSFYAHCCTMQSVRVQSGTESASVGRSYDPYKNSPSRQITSFPDHLWNKK